MGLSCCRSDLDTVAKEFIDAISLKNTAPIEPDMLALFIDAKYVEIRDGDRIRPASIYVVVGQGREGIKRILTCQLTLGRESLDNWKKVLRALIEGPSPSHSRPASLEVT
jgi:transposase-like protein